MRKTKKPLLTHVKPIETPSFRFRRILLWLFFIELRLNFSYPSFEIQIFGWYFGLEWNGWCFSAGVDKFGILDGLYVMVPGAHGGWRTFR